MRMRVHFTNHPIVNDLVCCQVMYTGDGEELEGVLRHAKGEGEGSTYAQALGEAVIDMWANCSPDAVQMIGFPGWNEPSENIDNRTIVDQVVKEEREELVRFRMIFSWASED